MEGTSHQALLIKTVCLWDTALDGLPELPDARLCALACSPNGTMVVSGSRDHTLRMWNSVSGEEIYGPLRGHLGAILSVSFSLIALDSYLERKT